MRKTIFAAIIALSLTPAIFAKPAVTRVIMPEVKIQVNLKQAPIMPSESSKFLDSICLGIVVLNEMASRPLHEVEKVDLRLKPFLIIDGQLYL